jgi:predicted Rdx family selenoprotein
MTERYQGDYPDVTPAFCGKNECPYLIGASIYPANECNTWMQGTGRLMIHGKYGGAFAIECDGIDKCGTPARKGIEHV